MHGRFHKRTGSVRMRACIACRRRTGALDGNVGMMIWNLSLPTLPSALAVPSVNVTFEFSLSLSFYILFYFIFSVPAAPP